MHAPDFWWRDGLAPRLLDPIGRLYGLAGTIRRHLIAPKPVGIPVICIGNLVAGGAGKTPTALAIAERLQRMGHEPHFLTRGYGGREKGPHLVDLGRDDADRVGDEPLLLAGRAPTWVSADRIAGAKQAEQAGATAIIMDDGLQNPHLRKDLAFLVIDGAVGFGNGRLIPAGPLRETQAAALARIDAVIVIGEDRTGISDRLPRHLPSFSGDLRPVSEAPPLKGRRLFAFAGIGRPGKFYETLRNQGADLAATRDFPDHHRYQASEITDILDRARQFDAQPITTEKDYVRIPSNLGNSVEKLLVRVHLQASEDLDRCLSDGLSRHAAGAK